MTRHKSEKTAEIDAKVKAAIEGLSNGLYSTPYAAAQALQLSRDTLYRRLAGGKSRAEGKENQQNLTLAEEQAPMDYSIDGNGTPSTTCFHRRNR